MTARNEISPYICRVCRHPLSEHEHVATGTTTWVHATNEDHEPIAVPSDETLLVIEVCDFCGDEGATESRPSARTTEVGVRGLDVGGERTDVMMGLEWAACATCAGLIDRGERRALAARAAAKHGAPTGYMAAFYDSVYWP